MVNITSSAEFENPKGGKLKGRGTACNPPGRFESLAVVQDTVPLTDGPKTEFFRDASRSILARNDSPDITYDVSVNPYRGCEHGCVYCYARPYHEFLGLSSGLDFETKIFVKEDAPKLLEKALSSRNWKPQMIALSGATDPYQPIEKELRLTRGCLEVLSRFGNPTAVTTKNYLVTRDVDLLLRLAERNAVHVSLSITTLDANLHRAMEPRTSSPIRRLAAIEVLAKAGIPVRVLAAPIIPGLTDHEIPAILRSARAAGAADALLLFVRLPYAVKEIFVQWLDTHYPERKERVLARIREMRDGKLNETEFHRRMCPSGLYADQIRALFRRAYRREGFPGIPPMSIENFRRPSKSSQMELF